MNDSAERFKFDPEWRITLATAALLPLLVLLGFWQLQRAEEKTQIAQTFEQRRHQAPMVLDSAVALPPEELAYLPVALQGEFINGYEFLLDNRIYKNRFGYEVLGLFRLDSGQLALVNRGWIAGDPGRMILPDVPQAQGAITVTGQVYVAPGEPFMLAEQVWEGPWPKRIQAVEMASMAEVVAEEVDGALFHYPIRIAPGSPAALTVDWQVVNVSPAKHLGYAVQWFSMAVVLTLYYLIRNSNLWQMLRGTRGKTP